jgi:pyruvate carboxylase
MKRALNETRIEGIETNLKFHRMALEDKLFSTGRYTTDFVEKQQIVSKVREQAKALEK